MKKIEQVYREILYQAMEKNNKSLTQLELSKKLEISLSIVNLALKNLKKVNGVKIEKMGFKVIDIKKMIYYWASIRNIEKDIIYKTHSEMPVREIEANMPDLIFGSFSAFKFRFKDVPADYSEVYVYANEQQLNVIKKRFPESKKSKFRPNIFILNADENAGKYGKTGTIAGIFVDLWNLKQWYANDFLKEFEKRLNF